MPLWLMIAQGVKQIADSQNDTQANNSNTQSNQYSNSNNAFSTLSSIYNNYLNGEDDNKKKNIFGQLFNRY